MKLNQQQLLTELIVITNKVLEKAVMLSNLKLDELNWKPNHSKWSALECLEHLNRYGAFYIPEITRRMDISKADPQTLFASGLLGNYFANSMKPKKNLNKMKTFKHMNPIGSTLDQSTIVEFIGQQRQMLKLLEKAKNKNLTKIKTGITISSILKLRLGDTFRVVIYHNQRHIEQAFSVLENRND